MENDLSNSYVVTTRLDLTGITQGLSQLQTMLQQPIKVAPVNLAAPTAPIAASTKVVTGLNTALVGTGVAAGGAAGGITKVAKATAETKNALTDVARRVFVWGSMSAAIFGALQSLKDFYDLTININTAMGELKKVMPSQTDFDWMKAGALDLSVSFGQAPTEVLKVMTLFAQAGLNAKEALDATRMAMLGINTTGADTESMFNALLGAARLFNVEFADSGRVLDKVMRIQADFAVSAQDLIASIQAVGPVVTTLGGDIDDLFAAIASMGEAARISGKEAANVMKRVYSLMVSPEGIKALQDVGVQVMATADSYRPLRAIMEELMGKWEDLTQTEQTHLALVLAQARQYPKFIAMLQNHDKYNEALTKSQNALNDAYYANLTALDTYAKKSEIASAKIAKLGTTTLETGGIAEFFVQTKVGLGEFAGAIDSIDLGGFGSKIASVAVGVGALTGAFVGLNALVKTKQNLAGFNAELAAMNEAGAVSQTQLIGLKRQFGLIPSIMQNVVMGLMGVAAVLTIASAAYGYFTEDMRRRKKIVQDSVDEFNTFKKSLESLDFSATAGITGTERFNSIKKVIMDIDIGTGTAKEKADAATDAFARLFYDVGKNDLTITQLQELETRLTNIKQAIDAVSLRPFQIEIDKTVKEMGGTLDDFVNQFSKKRSIRALQPAAFSNRGDIIGDKRLLTEYGVALNRLGDLGRSWWEINPTSISDIVKVGDAVNGYIDKVVALREAYAEAVKNGREFDDSLKRIQDTAIADNIKAGASELLKLIDTEKIFKAAAEGSDLAMAQAFQIDPNKGREKAAADMAQALQDLIKSGASEWARKNGADFQKMSQAIDASKGSITDFIKASQGLNTISIDTVAFMSGLKRSTAAVMSGFAAESAVLGKMYSSAGNMKEVFNVGEESIRAVDAAIQAVLQTFRQNESQLKTLEIEYKGLTALKEYFNTHQETIAPEVGNLEKIGDTIRANRERYSELYAIQQLSGEQLPKQLASLIELKKQLQEVLNIEKSRSLAIKAESDLTVSLLKQKTEINKIKYSRETDALRVNRDIYQDVLEAQLRYVDAQLRIGDIEASTVSIKKEELLYTYKQESIMREIETRVSKLSTLYGDLRNDAKGVGDAFAEVLTNQQAFLDDLDKKASAFQVFKRLAGSIAAVFAEADARIISNYISRRAEGLFPAAKSEVASLEAELDAILKNSTLGTSTGSAIVDAGTLAASKMRVAIIEAGIKAAEDMAEVYRSMASIAAKTIIDAQKEQVNGVANLAGTGGVQSTISEVIKHSVDTGGVAAAGNMEKGIIQGGTAAADIIVSQLSIWLAEAKQLQVATQTTTNMIQQSAPSMLSVWKKQADQSKIDAQEKAAFKAAMLRQIGMMGAESIGAAIAKSGGRDTSGVAAGGNIGTVVGGLAGPTGAIVGGLFGSIIGGLFGGKEEQEKQTKQLAEIVNNTAQLVDKLSPEIINAPSTFTMPAGNGFGGGRINIVNNFNVSGGRVSTSDLQQIERQINDVYSRSTKKYTSLA